MTTELVPTTALVAYKNTDQKTSTQHSTLFTRFLQTLQGFQEPTHTDAQTRVSHCDVPLVRILLSGTWMVMRKLGSQLELPLSTATDALDLGERVNRLLSAGMVLEYGTPEAAAHAFWREVIELVDTAHALGYQPGMQVKAAGWRALLHGNAHAFRQQLPAPLAESKGFVDGHWRAPCMLFVAKLFKRARTYQGELTALRDELNLVMNPASGAEHTTAEELHQLSAGETFEELLARETLRNGFLTHHAADDLAAELNRVIRHLNPEYSPRTTGPSVYREEDARTTDLNTDAFLSLLPRAREGVGLCKLWSHFHLYPKSWPAISEVSLDDTWLKTQILLSVIGGSDDTDAFSSVKDLNRALAQLQDHQDDQVLTLALGRLDARLNAPLSDDEMHTVRERILVLTRLMRSSSLRSNSTSLSDPASAISGYLVHLRDSDIFIDAHEALGIALGHDKDALHATISELTNAGEDPESFLTRVAVSILWSELLPETVLEIVRARVLKPMDIMDGFDSLRPLTLNALEGQHVRELVSLHEEDYALLNLVLSKGHRTMLSTRQLERAIPHLTEDNIDHLVDHVFVIGEDLSEQRLVLALGVLAGMSKAEHARRLCNHVWRTELAMSGVALLQNSKATAQTYDAIRERMGEAAYTSFVLASAAWARWVDPTDPEGYTPEAPWEQTFDIDGDPFIPPRVMGFRFTAKDGRALCERISEEEARAWTENG